MMNWTSATSDRSSEHLQHFLNVNVFLRIFCHPFPVLRRKCLFCVEFLLAVIFLVTCNNSRSCYREILSIFSWGRNDKKKNQISYYARHYARRLYNVFFWLFPIGPNAFHRQMLHVTWCKGQHRHFRCYWEKYFIGVVSQILKAMYWQSANGIRTKTTEITR